MKMDLVKIDTSTTPKLILIGPTGVGKSTLGLLLSDRLNLPSASMDEVADPYYDECNFGIAANRNISSFFCPTVTNSTIEH